MKRKILLYGDLSLNIVDGSSVWLFSLAKLLAKDKQNVVDILLKTKIENDILVKDLKEFSNITLLNANEYLPKYKIVDSLNIVKIMLELDKYRDYSCIIVRGFEVIKSIVKNEFLAKKLIPYITDFCHNKEEIKEDEKKLLCYIYERVNQFFVQTIQMQQYMEDILKVDGKKFKVLNPMIFESNVEKKSIIKKSIVYAGKLAKDWNILELIEIMDKLYKKDREITLHIIGDKFNEDLSDRKQEILQKLKTMPNVVFYGSLAKGETTEIINACELGYSFRSTEIDNNLSLELSSKVLEYCFGNVPLLLRRTKMHEDVLGKDYPLYVESTQECVNKIYDFFEHKEKYEQWLKGKLQKCVERFKPENVYKNILEAINTFPKKKLRVLITGHDLKFIKELYQKFEQEYELKIQQYDEYMNLNESESKELLKHTDIIWCEWLLLNAQWYSSHKFPHQKLYIRAHRFEIEKNYGYRVNWNRVTKVITVAYFMMEQFIEKFNIPREKVVVINNYIDVGIYITEKEEEAKYNLAMIGIVPKRKGFEHAIDILKQLKEKEPKYKLYVAGKRPEEFANSWNIPEEREYFEGVYQKIRNNNLEDSVIFTGWVKTSEFLRKIGYVLSLSDLVESFHIAPFEGMASNGIGMALKWEGIEYIYPQDTIYSSVEEIANKIEEYNHNEEKRQNDIKKNREFVIENYDLPVIWNTIYELLEN